MLYTYTQNTAQTKTNQHKCQPDPNTNKTAFCPNIIRDCAFPDQAWAMTYCTFQHNMIIKYS